MTDISVQGGGTETPAADNQTKHNWNTWCKKRGRFMLGTLVAVAAFGLYMQQPSPSLAKDTKGVASFVKCSGSLNAGHVNEQACRSYFEQYLKERIEETDNLPKIVPIEIIGATYQAAQKALEANGFDPLESLEALTKNKIQILASGKAVHPSPNK
ncbi:TPA: hypothetical protein ACGSTL_001394 [Vibrio parahaemolyticus]|uniref:hypothetical protein n=1 Tax=Vibrio campbellii TaxID=680 RepID=UPI001F07DA71|nr:hypothetical protein [Vibrio campbellii]UMM06839.1 hypothetical protein MKR81_26625 [Vibrio campbellii]